MTATAKDKKWALVVQQVSERTPLDPAHIANLMSPTQPMGVLFELLYAQIEGLQEANIRLDETAKAQQQRADVAAMKAQDYFVRLRDAGLLNKGESF